MKPTNLVSLLPEDMRKKVAGNMIASMSHSNSDSYHNYLKARDRAYFREGEKKPNCSPTPAHCLKDEGDKYENAEFEIPTVFSGVDSARARLNNIFLSATPIFKTVAPPEQISIGEQYDAVIEADSDKFAWALNLSQAHLDALKYDAAAVEVEWESLKVARTTRDVNTNEVQVNFQQIYAGNSIKRLDLGNAFWDTSVPLHKVHELGDYAGYVEPYTLQRLLNFLNNLDYTPEEVQKLLFPTEAQKKSPNFIDVNGGKNSLYQAPNLAQGTPQVSPEDSAARFDIPDSEIQDNMETQQKAVNHKYEIVKLYLRTIPAVLGIKSSAHDAHIPRLYKILILNGVVPLSIEETSYDHNYLPIVFASLMMDTVGNTSKSFAQNLESLQKLANKLVALDVQSSRRAIADRGIYNPHLIDATQMNNGSATAKIPLKKSSPTADVRAAYTSIPYSDTALGTRTQQAMNILGFQDQIAGSNPVTQGQFVKGNKTNQQFQESMAASEYRLLAKALGLHSSFYYPIKTIIKHNIAQFQTSEATYSQSLEKTVKINSEELKQMLPEFMMADGLKNAARMLNTEALGMAIQVMPNIPEFQNEYNTPEMIVDLLSNGEGVKLDRYRYTAEEKAQRMEQQRQMAEAEAQANNPPEGGQQAPPQQQAQRPGIMQRMFGGG